MKNNVNNNKLIFYKIIMIIKNLINKIFYNKAFYKDLNKKFNLAFVSK